MSVRGELEELIQYILSIDEVTRDVRESAAKVKPYMSKDEFIAIVKYQVDGFSKQLLERLEDSLKWHK